jgi:hypothetical protein
MAKTWKDPMVVAPPKNVLVEVSGVPNAEVRGSKVQFDEWRAAAFMGTDGEWYLPENTMGKFTPLGNVYYNEVYRWRDLRK